MAYCPFCGNELGEFDYICGGCGRELSDLPILLLIAETEYEQSKYGKYDSDLDTSVNKKVYKNKHQWKYILKKLMIFIAFAMIAYYGYQKVRGIFIRPYRNVVRMAVISAIENNYDLMISNRVIDYELMFTEYYGYWYLGLKQLYRQENQKCIRSMREKYGDNYKITTAIKSARDMEGKLKDEAIERAIKTQNKDFRLNEMDLDFRLQEMDLDCRAYLNRDAVKEVKRVKVKVTIKGSKDSSESDYVVDIAKVDGKINWKVLFVYEE